MTASHWARSCTPRRTTTGRVSGCWRLSRASLRSRATASPLWSGTAATTAARHLLLHRAWLMRSPAPPQIQRPPRSGSRAEVEALSRFRLRARRRARRAQVTWRLRIEVRARDRLGSNGTARSAKFASEFSNTLPSPITRCTDFFAFLLVFSKASFVRSTPLAFSLCSLVAFVYF